MRDSHHACQYLGMLDSALDTYPAHYPSDIPCPPVDAAPLAGTYFFFYKPPTPTRLMSHLELQIPQTKDACPCQRAGVSCSISYEDALLQQKMSGALRKKRIGQLDLTADHGVIKQTGRTPHHTAWIRANHLDTIHQSMRPAHE